MSIHSDDIHMTCHHDIFTMYMNIHSNDGSSNDNTININICM